MHWHLVIEMQLDAADTVFFANLHTIRVLADQVSGEVCGPGLCAQLFQRGHGVRKFNRGSGIFDIEIEPKLVPGRTQVMTSERSCRRLRLLITS